MDGSYRRGCFMYLFEFQLQHPDRQLLLFTPQVRPWALRALLLLLLLLLVVVVVPRLLVPPTARMPPCFLERSVLLAPRHGGHVLQRMPAGISSPHRTQLLVKHAKDLVNVAFTPA